MTSRDINEVRALEFRGRALRLLDQRKLPDALVWLECTDHRMVADAIRTLAVRGAPAIGLAAAYGVVLAAMTSERRGHDARRRLDEAMQELGSTRPTAVNLSWALRRMRRLRDAHSELSLPELSPLLLEEADRMMAEDESANRAMSEYGASLIPEGANVLTHCNTGALVSSGIGTALGAIRAAHENGKGLHVWVDETRPLLQGARLTTWELQQLDIPFTLITDSMAAHFMARGDVDLAMVGADRIAANGDTANKIGTYSVAVLARAHDLPFYVVAPTSTVDISAPSGASITIEERSPEEVTGFRGVRVAPDGAHAVNPAFDITPSELIAGIATECGIARHPFAEDLARHADFHPVGTPS